MTDDRWLLLYQAGENIDRLISLDLHHCGIIGQLYEAAREEAGLPLTLKGALSLVKRVKTGEPILLCTGFPIPPSFRGETDGIVGAAILARALRLGLQAHPVVVTEEENLPLVKAACEGAGLQISGRIGEAGALPHGVVLLSFPKEEAEARRRAAELVSLLNPPAVIAVEKPGRNRKGVYHSLRGVPITAAVAKTDELFLLAEKRGSLTIGIGDQGNELGMGSLKEVTLRLNRFGEACGCPCNGGIVAEVPADVTIVSGVSDWGALGLAAGLAFLTSRPDLLPEVEMFSAVLNGAVEAGAIDSLSHASIPWIDGIAEAYHLRLLEQLRDLLRYAELFRENASFRYEHALHVEAFQARRHALHGFLD